MEAFRPNQKVFVIILLTMTALFLPLFGVVWLARDYFASRGKAPVGQAEVPGIRETIERTAEEAMPGKPIAEDRPVVTIDSADGLQEAAKSLGATAIEIETGKRFLVSGPPGTLPKLSKALGATAPESDAELFEVVVAP